MNAVLVILALALVFYFMHRMHGQIGGCQHGHSHGRHRHRAGSPEDTAGAHGARPQARASAGPSLASLLVITLILLLPLMLLHWAAPPGSAVHPFLFWAALLLPLLVVPFLRAAGRFPSREQEMARLEAEEEAQEAEWRQRRLQNRPGRAGIHASRLGLGADRCPGGESALAADGRRAPAARGVPAARAPRGAP